MGGEFANVVSSSPRSLGDSGIEERYYLTISEMPNHNHQIPGYIQYSDGGSQSSGNVGLGDPANSNNP